MSYTSNWSRISYGTKDPEEGTSKTWDEWTDILGQTYEPGDYVAVAVVNGKSPQMVIGVVEQINRVNSKGELIEEGRTHRKEVPPGTPDAIEGYGGRWTLSETERRPSCTVKVKPLIDSRGFWRTGAGYRDDEPVRAVTYQFWQNIVKVDKAQVDAQAAKTADDLTELLKELQP